MRQLLVTFPARDIGVEPDDLDAPALFGEDVGDDFEELDDLDGPAPFGEDVGDD